MPGLRPRYRPPGPDLRTARTAAHRLAMAPFAFQAARSARDLGMLEALRTAAGNGLTLAALETRLDLPATSVRTLLDACLAIELVDEDAGGTWRLTTVGEVWLRDAQVQVDAEFAHTVCWHGMADLTESLRTCRPAGLRRFGPWATIYEGLASLPAEVRKPWFDYDHGHSDAAFTDALARLAASAPTRVLDVGGNTGRFATTLLRTIPSASVTILDHPGQVAEARANLAAAGFSGRSTCVGLDLLDHNVAFPTGQDAVWMSQFLDCFGPADVTALLRRARAALKPGGSVWVLEVCPDRQCEAAASSSLRLASLYFTALANGVSRFYRADDLLVLAQAAGLQAVASHDGLGTAHTLFQLQPATQAGSLAP